MSRFWAGRSETLKPPDGSNWRNLSNSLNEQRKELLESGSRAVPDVAHKPKKSKIMDMSEIRPIRHASPSHSHRGGFPRFTAPASTQKSDRGTDFLKKWNRRH